MQKLQWHDLTFQITRAKAAKKNPDHSAVSSCLRNPRWNLVSILPLSPLSSLLFGKSFLLFRPRLRAFSMPYSVKLLRDGLDGAKMVVKGNFVERVCSFLPIPSEARYNVGEEFSRSRFHRSCFVKIW